MSLDQSLAVAANSLCVIGFLSPAAVPASKISEQIAVNPVVIRRVVGKLVSGGLVESLSGVNGGYILARPADMISLQDVYACISDKGIFERSNSSPRASCPEGEVIGAAILTVFAEAETEFAKVLAKTTLSSLLEQSNFS